jgi:hypothetical protein
MIQRFFWCGLLIFVGAGIAAEPTAEVLGAAPRIPYEAGDVQGFLQRADDLALHQDPYWQVLLHMASGVTGRKSRVDDPAFFLAVNGKTDPRAELRADVLAWLGPATGEAKTEAINRFPARFEWLGEKLGIDRARLAVPACAEFEQIYAELNPRAAALVFPSAYMNTPASMFGHTLLLIKSQYQSTLLSQSINYAAVTTESNGIVFAFKGIFGLYSGYFSLLPYYQKVKEYTDLDQRDIWEYDLNLSVPEIRLMLLHVWEMRGIASDYFFFDENCSYNLLYLIDAGRPGLALNQETSHWVIPLDTIKLVQAAGLVSRCTYRPSRRSQVRHLAAQLPADDQERARTLSLGTGTLAEVLPIVTDPAAKALVLDLAAEHLQSLRGREKVSQADYQPRMLAILAARSAIDVPTAAAAPPVPPAPDVGHSSIRLSLGIGRAGDENFAEFGIRPVYHDLLDPPDGYLTGSQIEFMNLAGRWHEGEARPELERLDFIRLRSFTPRDRFCDATSWKIDVGGMRQPLGEDGDRHFQFYLNGGAGVAYQDVDHFGLLYALIEGDARLTATDSSVAAGAGPSAGLIAPIGRRWLVNPYARILRYFGGDAVTNWEIGCEQRLRISKDFAVGLDLSRSDEWEFQDTAISLRCLYYF